MISEFFLEIKGFIYRVTKDNVGAYSAQAAFFLFMSFMPFLSLLLTLVRFLPISQDFLYSTIIDILPKPFEPLIGEILNELFAKDSGTYLSISIILTVWAAAKGVMAIINGLNSVYHNEDNRNYFLFRTIAALYTLIFVSVIIITMLLLVFGNQIFHAIEKDFPKAAVVISVFMDNRIILITALLTLFFIAVYKIERITSKNTTVVVIPGSIFSAIAWTLLSYILSLYINNFSNFSYTYGSLATIVLFMLWMYFCMFLMFIGAEINSYFALYFESIHNFIFRKKKKNK